jgi:FAD/FMN-containing dehydrogenase
MANVSRKDRVWLEEKFGARANFRLTERRLYGHDIAAIPKLVKPLIGKTVPHVVVQPQTEKELLDLVHWAAKRRIPLVPRGKGSSGYGGIIPTKKGIVVDFYRMKDVFEVDVENETVTVQPGITWEQLDKKIKDHGLTVRLYPTSYPSSRHRIL